MARQTLKKTPAIFKGEWARTREILENNFGDLYALGGSGVLTLATDTTTGITESATYTTGMLLSGTFTTGISMTGTLGTGLSIGASTTGISLTGAKTTGIAFGSGTVATAIDIDEAAATTCAIAIGSGIAAGMPMTSTKNGLIRAFGQISATAALTNDIRGIWARVRQDADVDLTGGYSVVGIQGSCKAYGGSGGTTTTLWNHSGVYGSFESDGVASSNVASTGRIAGVMGVLGLAANFTVSSGGVAASLVAFSTSASAVTATGSYTGLYVAVDTGAKAFTNGVEIASSAATTGVNVGTCTTGVTVGTCTSAFNVSGTATNVINVAAATNVTNFAKFNAVAGCVLSVDVNPKDVPSTGGLGADGCLRIDIGGNDAFIPYFFLELS